MQCHIANNEERIEKEIGDLDLRLAHYTDKRGRNAMHARGYLRVLLRFKRDQLGALRSKPEGQVPH